MATATRDLVFSTWSRMSGARPSGHESLLHQQLDAGQHQFRNDGHVRYTADNHTNIRLADFDNDSRPRSDHAGSRRRERAAPQHRCARPTSTHGFELVDPSSLPVDRFARCRLRRSQRRRLARPRDRESRPSSACVISTTINARRAAASCGLDGPFDNFGPTIAVAKFQRGRTTRRRAH